MLYIFYETNKNYMTRKVQMIVNYLLIYMGHIFYEINKNYVIRKSSGDSKLNIVLLICFISNY